MHWCVLCYLNLEGKRYIPLKASLTRDAYDLALNRAHMSSFYYFKGLAYSGWHPLKISLLRYCLKPISTMAPIRVSFKHKSTVYDLNMLELYSMGTVLS